MTKKTIPLTTAMQLIEKQCEITAKARHALTDTVAQLQSEVRALERAYLVKIRKQVAVAQGAESELKTLLTTNEDQFESPRTKVFHGIKVGYQKNKGELTMSDEGKTIALIKRHFPDSKDAYIKTTQRVIKNAVLKMPAVDLKRISVKIDNNDDSVVIKSMDSGISKMVDALIKGGETDEATAKAA